MPETPYDAVPVSERPGGTTVSPDRLAQERRKAIGIEIQRRKTIAAEKRREALEKELEFRQRNVIAEQTLTDAVPTGNAFIDGTRGLDLPIQNAFAPIGGAGQKGAPSPKQTDREFAPDSREARMRDGANRGIDFRQGYPFLKGLSDAIEINTPGVREQVMAERVKGYLESLPPGAPGLQMDPESGEWMYLRQVTEDDVKSGREGKDSVGKYRWTSMNSANISTGDMAKILDLPEVGALIGGVIGAVGSRNLTFFRPAGQTIKQFNRGRKNKDARFHAASGAGGVAVETAAGFAGRELGNLIELGVSLYKGREIDPDEAVAQFTSGLGRDAAAAILGRAGARSLEALKSSAKQVGAHIRGMQPVNGTLDSVAERQVAMEETARDNAISNRRLKELGREEEVITSLAESETRVSGKTGTPKVEPSGHQRRINAEQDRRVNQGVANKTRSRDADSENLTALRVLADDAGPPRLGEFNAGNANQAMREGSDIRLSAVSDDPTRGRIHPERLPEGGADGLRFEISTDELKIVGHNLPDNLRDIGLGTDNTRAFVNLAAKEGRQASSGGSVTKEADATWQALREEGYDVRRHPNATVVKDAQGNFDGYVMDGNPNLSVYWVPKPHEGFTKQILATANSTMRRNVKGQTAKGKSFDDFVRGSYRGHGKDLAALKPEVDANFALRTDLTEAIFKNYDEFVNQVGKDGKQHYSTIRAEEWFNDADATLRAVLSPSEMLAIKEGGTDAFRKVVAGMTDKKQALTTTLGSMLRASPESTLFRNNTDLLKQMQNMPAPTRKRAWALIDHVDPQMGVMMRHNLKQQVKENVWQPVSKTKVTKAGQRTFGKWLVKNAPMLTDAFGDEYVSNLFRFNRSLARTATREGAKGVRLVVNTPILQGARTLMGVMNKWQRRITAGRRIQMQKWYGRVVDVVGEPDKLKQLLSIQEMQMRLGPKSNAMVGAAVRLGLVDSKEEFEEWQEFVNQYKPLVEEDENPGPDKKRSEAESRSIAARRGN